MRNESTKKDLIYTPIKTSKTKPQGTEEEEKKNILKSLTSGWSGIGPTL